MKIEIHRENESTVAASVEPPITPDDLTALADQLPAGVVLTSVEIDHDGTLYMGWDK